MELVTEGTICVSVPLDKISAGEYTLIVDELIGSKKADQPLVISGEWQCSFAF